MTRKSRIRALLKPKRVERKSKVKKANRQGDATTQEIDSSIIEYSADSILRKVPEFQRVQRKKSSSPSSSSGVIKSYRYDSILRIIPLTPEQKRYEKRYNRKRKRKQELFAAGRKRPRPYSHVVSGTFENPAKNTVAKSIVLSSHRRNPESKGDGSSEEAHTADLLAQKASSDKKGVQSEAEGDIDENEANETYEETTRVPDNGESNLVTTGEPRNDEDLEEGEEEVETDGHDLKDGEEGSNMKCHELVEDEDSLNSDPNEHANGSNKSLEGEEEEEEEEEEENVSVQDDADMSSIHSNDEDVEVQENKSRVSVYTQTKIDCEVDESSQLEEEEEDVEPDEFVLRRNPSPYIVSNNGHSTDKNKCKPSSKQRVERINESRGGLRNDYNGESDIEENQYSDDNEYGQGMAYSDFGNDEVIEQGESEEDEDVDDRHEDKDSDIASNQLRRLRGRQPSSRLHRLSKIENLESGDGSDRDIMEDANPSKSINTWCEVEDSDYDEDESQEEGEEVVRHDGNMYEDVDEYDEDEDSDESDSPSSKLLLSSKRGNLHSVLQQSYNSDSEDFDDDEAMNEAVQKRVYQMVDDEAEEVPPGEEEEGCITEDGFYDDDEDGYDDGYDEYDSYDEDNSHDEGSGYDDDDPDEVHGDGSRKIDNNRYFNDSYDGSAELEDEDDVHYDHFLESDFKRTQTRHGNVISKDVGDGEHSRNMVDSEPDHQAEELDDVASEDPEGKEEEHSEMDEDLDNDEDEMVVFRRRRSSFSPFHQKKTAAKTNYGKIRENKIEEEEDVDVDDNFFVKPFESRGRDRLGKGIVREDLEEEKDSESLEGNESSLFENEEHDSDDSEGEENVDIEDDSLDRYRADESIQTSQEYPSKYAVESDVDLLSIKDSTGDSDPAVEEEEEEDFLNLMAQSPASSNSNLVDTVDNGKSETSGDEADIEDDFETAEYPIDATCDPNKHEIERVSDDADKTADGDRSGNNRSDGTSLRKRVHPVHKHNSSAHRVSEIDLDSDLESDTDEDLSDPELDFELTESESDSVFGSSSEEEEDPKEYSTKRRQNDLTFGKGAPNNILSLKETQANENGEVLLASESEEKTKYVQEALVKAGMPAYKLSKREKWLQVHLRLASKKLRKTHQVFHGVSRDIGTAVLSVPKTGIVLHGTTWLSVLYGRVHVLGATLTPYSQPILFQSPFDQPLHIQSTTEAQKGYSIDQIKKDVRGCEKYIKLKGSRGAEHLKIRKNERKKLMSKVKRKVCLENQSEYALILVTEITRQLKEARSETEPRPNTAIVGDRLCEDLPKTCQSLLNSAKWELTGHVEPVRFLKVLESNKGLKVKVPKFLTTLGKCPERLLIVGAHNAGKSTLGRVIANYHITNNQNSEQDNQIRSPGLSVLDKDQTIGSPRPAIVYVDVDVGVPDRSLPGMISMHLLTDVSTSRQLGCRSIPLHGRFFGNTSPRGNIERYKVQVEEIIKLARSYAGANKLPLLVNSHGWATGAGASLLRDLCEIVQATCIARVNGANSSRSLKEAEHSLNQILSYVKPNVKIYNIEGKLTVPSKLQKNRIERDATFSAYFAQEMALGKVRRVKVTEVKILLVGHSNNLDDVTNISSTINGSGNKFSKVMSTKGLICTTVALGEMENEDRLVVNVKGMAIVRGVDEANEWLYISTPLPMQILQSCDVIMVSDAIETPTSLFHRTVGGHANEARSLPFWNEGGLPVGRAHGISTIQKLS